MSSVSFTDLEKDMFLELVNISMGKTASDLANIFDQFVELKIPAFNIESSEFVPKTVVDYSLFREDEVVNVYLQDFKSVNSITGVGAIIFNNEIKRSILPLLDLTEDDLESESINDFLIELASQLMDSCLKNIFEPLFNNTLTFNPVEVISEGLTLREIAYRAFELGYQGYDEIMCSKIDFIIASINFNCDLFFMIDNNSLVNLKGAIQKKLVDFQ